MSSPSINKTFCAQSLFLIFLVYLGTVDPVLGQTRPEKAEAEWKRLDDIQKTLSAPEYVGRNVDADLAAIESLPKYREHLKELEKEFSTEIKQDNQPFRNLGIGIRYMRDRLDGFERAAKAYGSREQITADLTNVLGLAKMGVENRAPAFFKPENSINTGTQSAMVRLKYLEAFEPKSETLTAAKKEFEDMAKQVSQLQASLSTEILAQNELPPDLYQAADRNVLIKMINDKWLKEGTKAVVLKTGIVTSDWNRTTAWEWQNRTLYKVDKSRIQGYVIVKHNDKVAVRHSINLVKDHLNADSVFASFLADPKTDPELIHQILLSKVK